MVRRRGLGKFIYDLLYGLSKKEIAYADRLVRSVVADQLDVSSTRNAIVALSPYY